MNKKKTKQYTFALLPPPSFIADLARINVDNYLYDVFKKSAKDDSVTIDRQTLKDIFIGKRKPQKSTADKIFKVIPLLEHDKYTRHILLGDGTLDGNVNVWETVLDSFRKGLGPYKNEVLPYFQDKLVDLIKIEKTMYKEVDKSSPSLVNLRVYRENKFISELLSPEEKRALDDFNCTQENMEVTVLMILHKVILYVAAHIDAEYSYAYKDEKDFHDETKKLGKVSVLQGIFPKYHKSKYIGPVRRLFEKWKDNFNTTYTQMQKFIRVDTLGDKDLIRESQKNKFKQWRRGKKVAKHDEILNIIKGIAPEIENNEEWSFKVLMFYHVALFWSNYYEVIRELNKKNKAIFKTDPELVIWMHENYDKFFDEAYSEVEKFYESA